MDAVLGIPLVCRSEKTSLPCDKFFDGDRDNDNLACGVCEMFGCVLCSPCEWAER